MERIDFGLQKLPEKKEGLTLALGNFDGLHLGHQSLVKEAELQPSPTGILFFKRPFSSSRPILSSVEDKIRYCAPFSLDFAYVLDNSPSFYSLSKEDFLRLLKSLGLTRAVVGEDFRFGKGKEGGIKDLQQAFETHVVPLVRIGGEKVSSTRIRESLLRGDVEGAEDLLGRPYEIQGEVVHGLQNGRKIGYPTLNLKPLCNYLLPQNGVYAGLVYLSGIPYKAMINVGVNPTIGKLSLPIAEAHLIGAEVDGYGKRAYFSFLKRIRGERKFASLKELSAQLKVDEGSCLRYFQE